MSTQDEDDTVPLQGVDGQTGADPFSGNTGRSTYPYDFEVTATTTTTIPTTPPEEIGG